MNIKTGTGPSRRGPSTTNVSPERRVEATAPDQATNNKARQDTAVTVENLKQYDPYTNTVQGQSSQRPGSVKSRRKRGEGDQESGENEENVQSDPDQSGSGDESGIADNIRRARAEAESFSREQPDARIQRDDGNVTESRARRRLFIKRYRQIANGSNRHSSFFDIIV